MPSLPWQADGCISVTKVSSLEWYYCLPIYHRPYGPASPNYFNYVFCYLLVSIGNEEEREQELGKVIDDP